MDGIPMTGKAVPSNTWRFVRRLLASETRAHNQRSPRRTYGVRYGIGNGLSPSTSGPFCHHFDTPHSCHQACSTAASLETAER